MNSYSPSKKISANDIPQSNIPTISGRKSFISTETNQSYQSIHITGGQSGNVRSFIRNPATDKKDACLAKAKEQAKQSTVAEGKQHRPHRKGKGDMAL